jgi:hypothetical protein
MKYILAILTSALVLSSCSPDWHIRRAKFKQPNILDKFNDTIQLTDIRLDTIYYNDTFQVVQTITTRDTIIQTRYLAPQTRYETRWKYKTIRDTVRIKERTARVEARQENRTERTRARRWGLLIIAAVAGFIIGFWINNKIKVHL